MINKKQFLASMVIGVGVTSLMVSAAEARSKEMEKCYGIVKATYNDCSDKVAKHSCAGGATIDGDKNEWILLPTGTCTKIVNGTLG